MKNLIHSLILLFSTTAFAADFKSKDAVDATFTLKPKSTVTAEIKPGFHINEKAPNKVTILPKGQVVKPAQLEVHKISFNIPKLKAKDFVKAQIYVCDDPLTVCETREWTWNAQGEIADATSVPQAATSAKKAKVEVKHGFYMNSYATAEKDCRAKKQPIMLLFSARWCPGCMRMEKEIWDQASMKPTLKKYAKVKLDSDLFENNEIMKKYSVLGIPTTLILNCDGEELERFVDYQEPSGFKTVLEHLASSTDDVPTHAELVRKAEEGNAAAAATLGERMAMGGVNAEALKWYAKVPTRENEIEYWWALTRQSAADNEKSTPETKEKLKFALEGAISKFPETPSVLDWRSQLADVQGGAATPEGKKTLEDLVKFCDELVKDPARLEKFNQAEFPGDYRGIEPLFTYQARAEALGALGKTDEETQAWKDAVAEGGRLGIKDEPSGQFFRFLYVLKKANEKERITKFFEKNLKKKPKDPELLRRYAAYLQSQGDFKRSADLALKSIEGSYDRNEIFAATVYATSLAKLGQVNEAKQFLLRYQARTDLPSGAKSEIDSTLAQLK